MLEDDDISSRHNELKDIADRVLDYLQVQLRAFLFESDDERLRESSERWRVVGRVKTAPSVLRKCHEVGVSDTIEIPDKIGDFIGLRIITKNKAEAKALFEDMQKRFEQNDWFCKFEGVIQIDAKTVDSAQKYAVASGYQAFHINFRYDSQGRYQVSQNSICTMCWPIEIQIMSELWAFYAEFSRRYFYKPEDPAPSHLAPYVLPLSKILDAADDLVSNILTAKREFEAESSSQLRESSTTINNLRNWLESDDRLDCLFGTDRIRNDIFLLKMVNLLKKENVTLEQLEEILQNEDNLKRYQEFLAASPGVYYLPPWQRTLMFILMNRGLSDAEIAEQVNGELWHRNLRIVVPPRGRRQGYLVVYDRTSQKGAVVDQDTNLAYYFQRDYLSPKVSDDELERLSSRKPVFFGLRLSDDNSSYVVASLEPTE